jgi:hypothetical protein
MHQICRVGYARSETLDLGRQEDSCTNVLGLRVLAREAPQVYLACPLDHGPIVLNRGAAASCLELGFNLPARADLALYARQLADHDVYADLRDELAPGLQNCLLFRDPKGTKLAVFNDPSQQVSKCQPNGVGPTKLGHIALVDFCCEVLVFKFSDSIEHLFVPTVQGELDARTAREVSTHCIRSI